MQKGQTGILILTGIVILIAVVGGIFFLGRVTAPKPEAPVTTSSPQPSASPQPTPTSDPTANWKTYASEFGYSFKYPANFWITSVQTSKPGVATIGDAPPAAPESTVADLEVRQDTIDEKFNLDARMTDHLRIYSEYKVLGQKDIQIATFPARYVEATVNNKYPIILVLVQKDNSYSVLLEASASGNKITSSQLKSSFDQILYTFKFIN